MKKPIAILVSDLHAGLKLPHAQVRADMTSSDRLEDVISVIDQMTAFASANKIANALILGDLFDKRHPDAPTLIAVTRALSALGSACFANRVDRTPSPWEPKSVLVLPGNHDAHDRAGKVYSIDLYREMGGHVDRMPARFELCGVSFCAIPWLPEPLFMERLEGCVKHGSADVCLFHQSVAGAVDNGRELHGGIPSSMFKEFALAITGHIHHPQKVGGNVQYLGAPLHLRFSDVGSTPRGFWVLYDDLSLELEPTFEPEFVRWRFVSDEDTPCAELFEQMRDDLVSELPSRFYLESVVEGYRDDVSETSAQLEDLFDTLRASECHDVRLARVKRVVLDAGASSRVGSASCTGVPLTDDDLFAAFIQWSKASWPDGLDERKVLQALKDLKESSS